AGAHASPSDRPIPAGALDNARADAALRYVGKRPGEPAVGQDEISRTLIELARAGRSVVRLKGGDPFVFGRGGEEAQALAEAGIPFEVVPGVTAGVAAPAYAGIPVTHRDDASAVAFVTGHEDPDKPESALDWTALAAFERRPLQGRSVVVTRARAQASELAARLRTLGAEAIEAPAIRIQPRESEELDRALEGIEDYSLVCLTSPNGAALLAEGLM